MSAAAPPAKSAHFELRTSPTTPPGVRQERMANPGFGRYFSDHMAIARWTPERGWHDAVVEPFHNLAMNPAAMVFHYGQSIFEGLKAYRQADGGVALFRPKDNAARFNKSAVRMAMPEVPIEMFMEATEKLVRVDREWIPDGPGQSFYLRPFMLASEAHLGVRPANEYLFMVIAGPTAPFFAATPDPISVWVTDKYIRAARGGTGEAKCSANYAASLLARREAAENGCREVVWLDAKEHRYIEEMGGMNVCFVWKDGAKTRITTPPLTGTILDGITRRSLLQLAPKLGYEAAEQALTLDEWKEASAKGQIVEVFACGTAAVIAPIADVKLAGGGGWVVGDGKAGAVSMQLRKALMEIQEGKAADPFGWRYELKL